MICSEPGCGRSGICAEAGSDRRWCVEHRPKTPPTPCDYVVTRDDNGNALGLCGTMEDTIWFRTPGGVELVRCREHRESRLLVRDQKLGY